MKLLLLAVLLLHGVFLVHGMKTIISLTDYIKRTTCLKSLIEGRKVERALYSVERIEECMDDIPECLGRKKTKEDLVLLKGTDEDVLINAFNFFVGVVKRHPEYSAIVDNYQFIANWLPPKSETKLPVNTRMYLFRASTALYKALQPSNTTKKTKNDNMKVPILTKETKNDIMSVQIMWDILSNRNIEKELNIDFPEMMFQFWPLLFEKYTNSKDIVNLLEFTGDRLRMAIQAHFDGSLPLVKKIISRTVCAQTDSFKNFIDIIRNTKYFPFNDEQLTTAQNELFEEIMTNVMPQNVDMDTMEAFQRFELMEIIFKNMKSLERTVCNPKRPEHVKWLKSVIRLQFTANKNKTLVCTAGPHIYIKNAFAEKTDANLADYILQELLKKDTHYVVSIVTRTECLTTIVNSPKGKKSALTFIKTIATNIDGEDSIKILMNILKENAYLAPSYQPESDEAFVTINQLLTKLLPLPIYLNIYIRKSGYLKPISHVWDVLVINHKDTMIEYAFTIETVAEKFTKLPMDVTKNLHQDNYKGLLEGIANGLTDAHLQKYLTYKKPDLKMIDEYRAAYKTLLLNRFSMTLKYNTTMNLLKREILTFGVLKCMNIDEASDFIKWMNDQKAQYSNFTLRSVFYGNVTSDDDISKSWLNAINMKKSSYFNCKNPYQIEMVETYPKFAIKSPIEVDSNE